jgi:hypothetical protein
MVLLERYQLLQEFLRGSRKVGNHCQESERIAMWIAMENLARTAGYPDPLRLQWAMEAQEIADMQDGPLIVKVDNVTVTLAINSFGEPNLTVEKIYKNGKTKQLQNIPSELKKHDDIIHLRERNTMIKQQASRMRRSLENSMCRMDAFTVNELANLLHHPVLKPLLESLVFVGDVGIGYFVDDGVALENHALGGWHGICS